MQILYYDATLFSKEFITIVQIGRNILYTNFIRRQEE